MSEIITSKQDANQVLRLAYDDATQSLRTTGSGGPTTVTAEQPDGSLLHTTVDQSALPDGAATEAKQDDQITALNNIVTTSGETATNTLASSSTLTDIKTNTTGLATETTLAGVATETTLSALSSKVPSGLVNVPFDEMVVDYVLSGNGVGEIQTVTYKLATATVATVSLSYDVQNRLTGVSRS